MGNITHPSFARRSSLSAGSRVLRNLICAAIQINIYPHKSSNSLAQWPASSRALHCAAYGAVVFKITLCNDFNTYNGNSNKKPSPSKSQLKAVAVRGESEEMFEVR